MKITHVKLCRKKERDVNTHINTFQKKVSQNWLFHTNKILLEQFTIRPLFKKKWASELTDAQVYKCLFVRE